MTMSTSPISPSASASAPAPAQATATATATSSSTTAAEAPDSPTAERIAQHVHYTPNKDPDPGQSPVHANPPDRLDAPGSRLSRSDSFLPSDIRPSLSIKRRNTRINSLRAVQDFGVFENRPGWQPGAEPGVDPSKPDGGHASRPTLSAACEITVVDFSQDDISIRRFDNESLISFLKLPAPKWATCRWINVKGLSWDVIQALGQYKKLHRLAIEDLMNTRNRTKADWYDPFLSISHRPSPWPASENHI